VSPPEPAFCLVFFDDDADLDPNEFRLTAIFEAGCILEWVPGKIPGFHQ
jgi:hypothetical protein